MFRWYYLLFLFVFACKQASQDAPALSSPSGSLYLTVLGIAQDGGYPQVGCKKQCCEKYYNGQEPKHLVTCLGLTDLEHHQAWLLDATPDFREQYTHLLAGQDLHLSGIFLTHAHMGHYSGLLQLGREVMSTDRVKVYAMPKMREFLTTNGPWSQLVHLHNIQLMPLASDTAVKLTAQLSVTPLRVPHRDEFSETVGFRIEGPHKKVLFIPDINKWHLWNRSLIDELKKVDVAYLDATFYQDGEINKRMSEVPHPFVVETTALLKSLPNSEKAKVHFIHLNHTNPALLTKSPADSTNKRLWIERNHFHVATEGEQVEL
jgi:pyrroloquinoline quinone biosynthesis protein B